MILCSLFLLAIWGGTRRDHQDRLFGICCPIGCGSSKYDNYTLLRIIPHREQHIKTLTVLPTDGKDLEILKRSYGLNDSTDVLVSPDKRSQLEHFANQNGMSILAKHYYGRSFEPTERAARRRFREELYPLGYNSFDAINNYIDDLAARKPDLVQVEQLGYSYERRPMRLVKISKDFKAGNPVIFIDAGIHAREWVAPSMATYIIHRLTSDRRGRELDGVDWYILPVVNPDGYEYTRSNRAHRLWRKTRSKTAQECYGVDGNRNYGFKWGVSGVSHNPCDKETYAGPQPFSEPETQMVRDVMMMNQDRIKLYVSLHAYGQYLVYPWGFTGASLPKTWKKLDSLARKVSASVQRAGGQPFKVLSAGKWYPAAGGSDDYAFGAMGIPYSYTMELTDGYEFVYPESNLPRILPQFYEGFKTFGDQIKYEFGKRCKFVRQCYHDMLTDLQEMDEKTCIEDVEVGTSTMMVYFSALKKYCGHIFNVTVDYRTFDSRDLYEVVIHLPETDNEITQNEKTPVILIDAGQCAGVEPVIFSLLIIERLTACEENELMIQNVRWVILPSVNPDGFEYVRFNYNKWRKNTRTLPDGAGEGVDISRNFDAHFGDCLINKNGYSNNYPGTTAASEAETMFVQDMIKKHRDDIKAYLSIRRDGHSILYPYAYTDKKDGVSSRTIKTAESVGLKVNQRGSSFQIFVNESIYKMNGKAQCGSSVDYAHNQGIALAYEMRIGYSQDIDIIQKFQRLPTGLESTLRNAYFAGIRELYTIIAAKKQDTV